MTNRMYYIQTGICFVHRSIIMTIAIVEVVVIVVIIAFNYIIMANI